MKKFIILGLIALIFPLLKMQAVSKEDETQMVVRLATESQLLPMYVAHFLDDESGFDKAYIANLENILNFDLNHNGMTSIVKRSTEKETLATKTSFLEMGSAKEWQSKEIYYVIKARIQNKKMDVRMLSVNTGNIKSASGISLSGDLNKDRGEIHKLSDTIHKTLFGTEGIATTKILYTLKSNAPGNKWLSDIWEADYDGGNAHKVISECGYCVTPLYVPPRNGYAAGSIFFVSYKTGQPKIYMASLEDGIGRRLTLLKGNQLMPTLSRQRDKIAFISDVTGNPDLFLQTFSAEQGAIGKPRQIFATHQATQGTPTFSPDGKKIAFVSNKDGSARIYVMDIPEEGKRLKDINAKLLTKHCKESTAPAWSPDGTKLAYCAMVNGSRQIWIYDFIKNEERQLTQDQGHKENPSWAPNSLHIVYNSVEHNSSDLYLINLNQQSATKISSGPGEKRFPNWEPK
jgi:TolB protein